MRVDSHVDDGGAGLDVFGDDQGGAADGGDENIGRAREILRIARFRVANGDGGVGVHQQQRHGLADDVAAADDHGVCAFDGNCAAAQNFHHAKRSARDEAGATLDELADVDGMKAVDVLGGIDGFENFLGVDLRRKRELHENAVDVVAGVEFADDGEQLRWWWYSPRA